MKKLAISALFGGLVSLLPTYGAVYVADFSGADGAFPDYWSGYAGDGTVGNSTTPDVNANLKLDGSGNILHSRPTSSGSSASTIFLGDGVSGSDFEDGILSNVSVSAVFSYTSSGYAGILIRTANEQVNPQSGYMGVFRSSGLQIHMDFSLNNSGNPIFEMEYAPGVELVSGENYLLNFRAIGSQLTVSLYNESGDTLLATLSGEDSTYTSGYTGLRSRLNNTSRSRTITDFQVEVIPEPGEYALFAIGALAIGIAYRRQKALAAEAAKAA